jgi:hypothetical protein
MNLPAVAMLPQAGFTGRYWSLQIDDASNSAGYLDLARLMVCGGFQPSVNLAYGTRLGLESESVRKVTDGGEAKYFARPRRRTLVGSIDSLPRTESLPNWFDMQRIAGTCGQFFFVFDPQDTVATNLHRRAFPAVFRELSPLECVTYDRDAVPIALVEEL